MYNFLIYLLPLKSPIFVVHFSNTFRYGNEGFPKGISEDETTPLLVTFHLPYSKYWGVMCRYQNHNFSLVLHWFRLCSALVALVLFVQHSCCTRVALVSLVCGTRVVN